MKLKQAKRLTRVVAVCAVGAGIGCGPAELAEPAQSTAEVGQVKQGETYSGKDYRFITAGRTIADAAVHCASLGNYSLVTIDDLNENAFLLSTIQNNATYNAAATSWGIGFNDRNQEGTFAWVGAASTTGWTNWLTNQPDDWTATNGQGEDCAILQTGTSNPGKWNDAPCSARAFICEQSLTQLPAVCGNGRVDSGEECDDGNRANKDGCYYNCRKEGLPASISSSHSLMMSLKGTTTDGVYAAGDNRAGALGTGYIYGQNGYVANEFTPVKVAGLNATDIKDLSAGYNFSLALKNDNTVWAWGGNGTGQLGDGTTTNRYVPVAVLANSSGTRFRAKAVAAGAGNTTSSSYALAVGTDTKLYFWGSNHMNMAGDGTSGGNRVYPSPVKINVNGTLRDLSDVVTVAAGSHHALALTAGGDVYAWGCNYYGQLGLGSSTQNQCILTATKVPGLSGIVDIAAGTDHSLALKADGNLYGFGSNYARQLGELSVGSHFTPTLMPWHGAFLAIEAGNVHTVGLLGSSPVLVSWGSTYSGALGNGNVSNSTQAFPVYAGENGSQLTSSQVTLAAGDYNTIVVEPSKLVRAWGYNGDGQLGIGNNTLQGFAVRPILP